MRKSCEGCIYYKKLAESGASGTSRCCHYLADTGKVRDCPAWDCKYKDTNRSHIRTLNMQTGIPGQSGMGRRHKS